jgi:hypothetical protein
MMAGGGVAELASGFTATPVAAPVIVGGGLLTLQGITSTMRYFTLAPVEKPPIGSYTNTHESGKKYHGKGTEKRMNESGKEKAEANDDPVVNQEFKPAANNREALKDEARRIREDGGVDNPNNYNKINSPGEKYLKQDGE